MTLPQNRQLAAIMIVNSHGVENAYYPRLTVLIVGKRRGNFSHDGRKLAGDPRRARPHQILVGLMMVRAAISGGFHHGPGLQRDQRPRGVVPYVRGVFVIGFYLTVGNGAQVEGGASPAANVPNGADEFPQDFDLFFAPGGGVRESGGHQAEGEAGFGGCGNQPRRGVRPQGDGAPIFTGNPELSGGNIEDNTGDGGVVDFGGERDRVLGLVIQEVDGAVDGVDDPGDAGGGGGGGALLPDHAIAGTELGEHGADDFFGCGVDNGHGVDVGGFGGGDGLEVFDGGTAFGDDLGRGGGDGDGGAGKFGVALFLRVLCEPFGEEAGIVLVVEHFRLSTPTPMVGGLGDCGNPEIVIIHVG